MVKSRTVAILAGVGVFALMGTLVSDDALPVEHAECPFCGANHDKFVRAGSRGFVACQLVGPAAVQQSQASELTQAVVAGLPPVPPGTRTGSLVDPATSNTIDRYIFQALAENSVAPAPGTTDYEFIRRITLDLTGRIPSASAVTNFVSDTTSDKRSKYIESLLASPQWVDKWTMYFGDFFQNNSRNTQIVRIADRVVAFNNYIRASLPSNKPYDQLARVMIAAQRAKTYTQF